MTPDYDGAGFALPAGTRNFGRLSAGFRWAIPERYNIGIDVADRPASLHPDRPAILEVASDASVGTRTFGALRERSNRLANALRARGIGNVYTLAVLAELRI